MCALAHFKVSSRKATQAYTTHPEHACLKSTLRRILVALTFIVLCRPVKSKDALETRDNLKFWAGGDSVIKVVYSDNHAPLLAAYKSLGIMPSVSSTRE